MAVKYWIYFWDTDIWKIWEIEHSRQKLAKNFNIYLFLQWDLLEKVEVVRICLTLVL